jgi:hypothetical protein
VLHKAWSSQTEENVPVARAILAVYSQPANQEQDAEYNTWYDDVHIPQVRERIPDVKGATRYRLSETQIVSSQECPERRYLTIYDIQTDDLPAVRDRLVEALDDGSLDWSDALDMMNLGPVPHFYEPPQ